MNLAIRVGMHTGTRSDPGIGTTLNWFEVLKWHPQNYTLIDTNIQKFGSTNHEKTVYFNKTGTFCKETLPYKLCGGHHCCRWCVVLLQVSAFQLRTAWLWAIWLCVYCDMDRFDISIKMWYQYRFRKNIKIYIPTHDIFTTKESTTNRWVLLWIYGHILYELEVKWKLPISYSYTYSKFLIYLIGSRGTFC